MGTFVQKFGIVGLALTAYIIGRYLEQADDKTLFRNKSKLFGGRELPPGQELWK